MTGTITLTAAMRANLLSLQDTGKLLSTTQLALSTGNKVNSALDNPVNFFAAQALNRRASSLSALLDGMGQAIQTINATNQGITSITTLVNQLTSIANSAKTDLAKTTTVKTLESSGGANSGMDSSAVADLTTGTIGGGLTAPASFSLSDGTNPAHTFTIDAQGNGGTGTSLQNVVDAINQVTGFNASIVYGDGTTLSSSTVSDGTGTPGNTDPLGTANGAVLNTGFAYLKVVSSDGKDITATDITANTLAGLGITTTASVDVKTGGSDAADVASYAAVIAQINQTVTDSNYQGNNLIDGLGNDLTVQVNELSAGAITVTNKDLTNTGLALGATATNAWASTTDINTDITAVNAALDTLARTASGFANSLSLIQTRQDFTNNLVNTLKDGASQLTIADKNEEGASLLALQTQQQLGIEALSLSSQANQSVLRLFA